MKTKKGGCRGVPNQPAKKQATNTRAPASGGGPYWGLRSKKNANKGGDPTGKREKKLIFGPVVRGREKGKKVGVCRKGCRK